MKRHAQLIEAPVVDRATARDTSDEPSEFKGPWLRTDSAARFLDFHGKAPVDAFRMWAKRHGVRTAHVGRRVIYAKVDLLRAIGASTRRSV